MTPQSLFSGSELTVYLERELQMALADVSKRNPLDIQSSPEATAIEIIKDHTLAPLGFDFANTERSSTVETTVQRQEFGEIIMTPATGFDFTVPLTGTTELMGMRASTFSMSATPSGTVSGNTLKIRIVAAELTAEFVTTQLARLQSDLNRLAGYGNEQVAQWNSSLAGAIIGAVNKRKQILDHADAIAASLDGITD